MQRTSLFLYMYIVGPMKIRHGPDVHHRIMAHSQRTNSPFTTQLNVYKKYYEQLIVISILPLQGPNSPWVRPKILFNKVGQAQSLVGPARLLTFGPPKLFIHSNA